MLVTVSVSEIPGVADESEIDVEGFVQQRCGLIVQSVGPPGAAEDNPRMSPAGNSTPRRPVGGAPRSRAGAQGHLGRTETGVFHPAVGQDLSGAHETADQDV